MLLRKPKLAIWGQYAMQLNNTANELGRVREAYVHVVEVFDEKVSLWWFRALFTPPKGFWYQARNEAVYCSDGREFTV